MKPRIVKKIVFLLLLTILTYATVGSTVLAAMPEYRRKVLPNDLVLLISEAHGLPMISVYLLLDAGAWRDPEGREGLASLTVNALRLGTGAHSGAEISEILDFNGAVLASYCERDFAVIGFHALRRNFKTVMGLFREMLMQPAFPVREVERKIAEIQADIRSEQDQPGIIAAEKFRRKLYKGSPYGYAISGTQETLARMSREDVAGFHREFYRPNLGIMAVVGDIDPQTVQSAIEAPLKAWKPIEAEAESFESEFAAGPTVIETHRPIDQAHIVLGHRGIARSNKEYYALSVMNQILGAGGFSSRLMNTIRVERGLAYAVHSTFHTYKQRGSFTVELQTQNASAGEAVRLVLDEMEKMCTEGVTAQELVTAKKYLIGNFPLNLITRDSFARFIAQVEYYQLGKDYYADYPSYIDAVTRQEVQQAAAAYLHPERYLLSIVADLEKVDLSGLRP